MPQSRANTPTQGAPGRGAATEELAPGTRVLRYEVRRLLGSGGAGRVYAAFDPELDREIALKVLHRCSRWAGTERTERLLREARAMASLSHPNVAQVHHVAVEGERVCIAMELLPGGTLDAWLRAAPRSWRDIVGRFVAAGRGLAHAHAAGLVHRDFKPENVLLDGHGTPRVTDFGLARRQESETNPGPVELDGTLEPLSDQSSRLGTPAYMAPEQYLGDSIDARADQFSFAVALYEALWGRRPFAGRSVSELGLAVTTEPPAIPPRDGGIPRRLWRILRVALERDPVFRYPSMSVLLLLLERERSRSAWARPLAGLGALGLLTLWTMPVHAPEAPPCELGQARADALWSAERRETVRAAFEDTRAPGRREASRSVTERLDRWSAQWGDAHASACPAGDDPRLRCLTAQLVEVDALLGVLGEVDLRAVRHSAELAERVPDPRACDDGPSTLAWLPTDPRHAGIVGELRRLRAQYEAAESAGRAEEALAFAQRLMERAEVLAAPRALATAHLLLGQATERAGRYDEALAHLSEAEHLGAAHELLPVAVEASVELAYVTAYRLSRPEEGRRWARSARAAIERAGGVPASEVRLRMNEGSLLAGEGRYGDALAAFDDAARLVDGDPGLAAHLRGTCLVNAGLMLHRLGRDEEAERRLREAVDVLTRTRGPMHPNVAAAHNNLGIALEHQGHHDAAATHYQHAIQIREAQFGEAHPSLASPLNNLANLAQRQRDYPRAITLIERALAIREAALGAEHPKTAFTEARLAEALTRSGRHEDALARFRRALAAFEAARGPDHPDVADVLLEYGEALIDAGQAEEAVVPLTRAVEIQEEAPHRDAVELARAQLRLGEAYAASGRPGQAEPWFERASPELIGRLPPEDADRVAVMAHRSRAPTRPPRSR